MRNEFTIHPVQGHVTELVSDRFGAELVVAKSTSNVDPLRLLIVTGIYWVVGWYV